jgi:hypothetical protein
MYTSIRHNNHETQCAISLKPLNSGLVSDHTISPITNNAMGGRGYNKEVF